MPQPLITVIMPVYNAERTIETALKSIRMQTIPAEDIEILVIDGGSTDQSRAIARTYGAVVIDNPLRLPEPAKRIGLQCAQGRYVVRQDSDEELLTNDQLQRRLELFQHFPDVKGIVCDKQIPGKHGGLAARYLCLCGDPFSQFVYRSKASIIESFGAAIAEQDSFGCLLRFNVDDLTPIGDGGTTMFDLQWIKQAFPEEWDSKQFTCSVFNHICTQTGCCGCIPGDDIVHHVHAGVSLYLSKLRFRVVNNLFHPQESGFTSRSGRRVPGSKLRRRKHWFILYALSVLGPLLDGIRLAIRYGDLSMLLHFFYVYFVCANIAFYSVKKLLGWSVKGARYGK